MTNWIDELCADLLTHVEQVQVRVGKEHTNRTVVLHVLEKECPKFLCAKAAHMVSSPPPDSLPGLLSLPATDHDVHLFDDYLAHAQASQLVRLHHLCRHHRHDSLADFGEAWTDLAHNHQAVADALVAECPGARDLWVESTTPITAEIAAEIDMAALAAIQPFYLQMVRRIPRVP